MAGAADRRERVLVIKLGALGDVVQALGQMAAIRKHHAGGRITLLTTAPYEQFLRASGLADDIWLDARPGWTEPLAWLALRRQLRGGHFTRVYDLQTSDRSSGYFRLFPRAEQPEWSGVARGCSHPHRNPDRDRLHTVERQREQLRDAGIADVPAADLGWATADTARFGLDRPYVLLAPGGSAHRPAKRWPAASYAALAVRLAQGGVTPALLGTESEAATLGEIAAACPEARNLMGETGLLEIAALARGAAAAVGNDSGPMHLVAAAGAPSVVLFSDASDPVLCGQRGPAVEIIRRVDLGGLAVEDVAAVLGGLMERSGRG